MSDDFFGNTGIPSDIVTRGGKGTRRIKVDVAQTGFFEGREFRFVRKLTSPIVYKFVAPVEFILSLQAFGIVDGEYEFYAWRDDNVTESTPFNTELPVFNKNTSVTRPLYGNDFYQRQCQIFSGGTITVANADLYADYEHLKTANATAQKTSIEGSGLEERYLAVGTYYLQFTGVAEGLFRLTWEERP